MADRWAEIEAKLLGLGEDLEESAASGLDGPLAWNQAVGFDGAAAFPRSPLLPVVEDFPESWAQGQPPSARYLRPLGESPAVVAHGLEFKLTERWCPGGLPEHSLFLGEAWFQRSHPFTRGEPFVSENAVAVLYQERPGEDVVAEQAQQVRHALAAHLEDPGLRVREIPLHGTGACSSLGYTRTKSSRWLDKEASEWRQSRDRAFESYTRVGGLLLVVSVTSHEQNRPDGAMSNKDMNCLMECLTAITAARIEGRY